MTIDNSTIHYQGQRRQQKQASLAVCCVIGTSCLAINVLSDLEPFVSQQKRKTKEKKRRDLESYKFRTKLFSYNTFIELVQR